MKIKKLKGLLAAAYTPMYNDGNLNLSIIEQYSEKLKMDELKGVFVNGTSGEGISLTIEERKKVLEEWIKYKNENFRVLVHVGAQNYKDSIILAEHAQNLGVDGIASISPTFFKPDSVNQLVNYFELIASAAPQTQFYYYNIPSFTGVNISTKEFLETGSKKIPTLAGVKFTHSEMNEMHQSMMVGNGKFDIIHGFDEMLLCGLSLGIKAAIGSTYNYMAPNYLELISAFEQGNLQEARELQARSVKLVEILIRYRGGVVAGKAILSLMGINCGPCRLPLNSLSKDEIDSLRKELESIDLFK